MILTLSSLCAQVRRFNPFGQGLRNCLGQQLARMNIPTAIAMFVSNFKLELTLEVTVLTSFLRALTPVL